HTKVHMGKRRNRRDASQLYRHREKAPDATVGGFVSLDYFSAMASISHRAPLGRSFTATQLRAGLEVKYLAYTSLKAAKSLMLARKQVVLTTLSRPEPAASRMAPTFLQLHSA